MGKAWSTPLASIAPVGGTSSAGEVNFGIPQYGSSPAPPSVGSSVPKCQLAERRGQTTFVSFYENASSSPFFTTTLSKPFKVVTDFEFMNLVAEAVEHCGWEHTDPTISVRYQNKDGTISLEMLEMGGSSSSLAMEEWCVTFMKKIDELWERTQGLILVHVVVSSKNAIHRKAQKEWYG